MRRAAGFGLVEFMITIAIMGLLASYAIPAMRASLINSQMRLVAQRFIQDFSWLRGQAVTGNHTISLTVRSDCSWSSSQDGIALPARSFTTTQVSSTAPGLACTSSGTFPLVFGFSSQGFLTGTGAVALTFTATTSQAIPLQLLNSGAVIRSNGAS